MLNEIQHLDRIREFEQELKASVPSILELEWNNFLKSVKVCAARRREVLLPQTEVCNQVLYLMSGILASEYRFEEKAVITRFFQKGNFSSNIVSAESQSLAEDTLLAITDVNYISIPFDLFIHLYLHSSSIGLFIRKKIIQNSIENKKFTTIKTISSTEKKYTFLEENYPDIIRHTPSKYIANFIGISPEALSRFLGKRYKA